MLRRAPIPLAVATAFLLLLVAFRQIGAPGLKAAGSVTYPSGWNLVAGPQGSILHGATGLLYTLQPGDTDYETFPVSSPLHDGIGYYAYFPTGGSIDLHPGVDLTHELGPNFPVYSIRLRQRQWIMVGNPSDTAVASIGGDVEVAQISQLAPGQGTFVLSSGIIKVIIAANSPGVTPTPSGPPPATPLPPCVDGRYDPGTAGNGCRPTGQTQPTARCYDGTFDYSRSTLSCAGHGGVAYWVPGLPGEAVPPTPPATSTGTGTGTVSACTAFVGGIAGGNAPKLCNDGTCSANNSSGTCNDHAGTAPGQVREVAPNASPSLKLALRANPRFRPSLA